MSRRVVVTGADGFLGWHLRVRLLALGWDDVVPVGRTAFDDRDGLVARLRGADVVVHLAGANRGEPDQVASTNLDLARKLSAALHRAGGTPVVIFANSKQVGSDTPYGRSKAAAAHILQRWAEGVGARFVDVVLPNLFGEHGRPHYNSFVATFCHEIARGRRPDVHDRGAMVEVLHVEDACTAVLEAFDAPAGVRRPIGEHRSVGEVLDVLHRLARTYVGTDLPDRGDLFERRLFNTYRAALWPEDTPRPLAVRSDPRGSLFEAVRSSRGAGQTFVSTTAPGQVRGDHFHLQKLERFLVVRGTAEIRLRRVLSTDVLRFKVTGHEPVLVDMPVLWAHAIENTGDDDLITLFWTDELFDQASPDTFHEVVDIERAVAA